MAAGAVLGAAGADGTRVQTAPGGERPEAGAMEPAEGTGWAAAGSGRGSVAGRVSGAGQLSRGPLLKKLSGQLGVSPSGRALPPGSWVRPRLGPPPPSGLLRERGERCHRSLFFFSS